MRGPVEHGFRPLDDADRRRISNGVHLEHRYGRWRVFAAAGHHAPSVASRQSVAASIFVLCVIAIVRDEHEAVFDVQSDSMGILQVRLVAAQYALWFVLIHRALIVY